MSDVHGKADEGWRMKDERYQYPRGAMPLLPLKTLKPSPLVLGTALVSLALRSSLLPEPLRAEAICTTFL
jgi:hypothetical protein